MTLLDALQGSLPLLYSVCFILGLFIGSFLNVVVYRLPLMMEAGWRRECHDFLELEQPARDNPEPFNLMVPRSTCSKCKSAIAAWQNIPVLSWLLLRGKCANCKNPISGQYPLVELLTGVLSLAVAMKFGASIQTCFALLFTWALITLALIDLHTTLLPDSITLPLLWLGLMLSLYPVFIDTHQALIGAAAGYMILWCVFQAFKLITGKEGMGFGDFKLLAALGAWLGWAKLPLIILLSSLAGAVIGITLMMVFKHSREKPIPFGPYLAIAGWVALIWGDRLVQMYNAQMGL